MDEMHMKKLITCIASALLVAAGVTVLLPDRADAKECKPPLQACKTKPGSCCKY